MITGKQLKRFRHLCNYKQDYVAQKMNLSVRTYRKLENEELPISSERKALALKILNITEYDLHYLEEQVNSFLTTSSGFYARKKNFDQILQEKDALIRQKDEEIQVLRNTLIRYGIRIS